MKKVIVQSIIQKSNRPAKKKGYIDVKFRTRFINPLTEKRREILSSWYTVPNKKDDKGQIYISAQVKALVLQELQDKANQVYHQITKEEQIKYTDITLDSVWNEWHKRRIEQKLVAPKTLAGEDGRYRNHILKAIPKETLLKNIPTSLIQDLLDQLYPIGNHKRIAQGIKSDLSSIFKFAITKDYLHPNQNPMPFITIGKKGLGEEIEKLKRSNIEEYYLESWELKEVLDIVRNHNEQYARIFEFQALTGMRIGEVLGLKEEAIDFNRNTISIIRTRATHGGASENGYEGNVKNIQSYRTIQLSSRALEILKEEIALNNHHKEFNPDYNDNGWVFSSKSNFKPEHNGNPLHYGVLNNFLNSPQNGKLNKNGKPRRAGIDIDNKLSFKKHISTHIFRHTHISFLAEQGVPLEAIQDRVGHTRGSRVTDIYLHVTQKTKDSITPLIDSLTK